MKTTFGMIFAGCGLVLALAAPMTAQKPDTVFYQTATVPVWVAVQQVGKEGVKVATAVMWDHTESGLPFAADVLSGELVVTLPTSKRGDDCAFTNDITHGADDYEKMAATDDECATPPVSAMSWIGVTHHGSAMKCVEADYKGRDSVREAVIRIWGCYWATRPGGGA